GTGYSSLGYLARFPINTLKIDQSFVSRMDSEENLEIVRAIVTLARNLRMDVTAEGVETGEQLALLRKLGCDHAQGFFFSEPLDHHSIAAMIGEERNVKVKEKKRKGAGTKSPRASL